MNEVQTGITVYVRKPSVNDIFWERYFVKDALVTSLNSANSNISAKGFVPNSSVVVRFPPSPVFTVSPGDRIYIGGTDEQNPPSGALSVLSVTGGDRGARTIRLIKAVCG